MFSPVPTFCSLTFAIDLSPSYCVYRQKFPSPSSKQTHTIRPSKHYPTRQNPLRIGFNNGNEAEYLPRTTPRSTYIRQHDGRMVTNLRTWERRRHR
ncbi:hypothetical protein BT93_H1592 [Corymbia citriodora subsp. variegata]|nr:hypothetical protein BT93_H1592 [Corymbia citriodora subsp. variegata]